MLDTCTLAVLAEMNSAAPISRLLRPSAIRRRTSRSRAVRTRQVRRGPARSARRWPFPRWPFPFGRSLLRRTSRHRTAQAGPAGQVVQGRAQRRGAELIGGAGGQPPLLLSPGAVAGFRERLGEPPPGAGDLVEVGRPELSQHRVPRGRVVLAAARWTLRLPAGQPATPLGPQPKVRPERERGTVAGQLAAAPGPPPPRLRPASSSPAARARRARSARALRATTATRMTGGP